MMEKLKAIQTKQREYLVCNGGVLGISEADEKYNDMNREVIEAFKNAHGTAFLGNVNFYGEKRQDVARGIRSIYGEYTGQLVHNFECDFVVPNADEMLEVLIRQWNSEKRSSNCAKLVDRIMDRIQEIGGINLIWY